MPTVTPLTSDVVALAEPPVLPHGPIVVSSDASTDSDAAFPLAQTLSSRIGATVQVVSAVRPFTLPTYGFEAVPIVADADTAIQEGRMNAINEQLARMVPAARNWPKVVRVGEPATEVADFAGALNARVIIAGRGRHSGMDRLLNGETILRLLQVGNTPVLATEPTLTSPARRVVIATDFSEFSLYAAEVAVSLIAPDAHVYLVNVKPFLESSYTVLRERAESLQAETSRGFAMMRERLQSPGLTIEERLVEGGPSEALTALCRDVNADLVVSSTHGYGFFRRMVLGSVAASLVREAPCSVLCVPGSARTVALARARASGNVITATLPLERLDHDLALFCKRNAGRFCNVEVDQSDLGAQVLGRALRLVGATYDPHNRQVSLMFGASGIVGQHLTHTIAGVDQAELSTDGAGRDQVLRLTTAEGHTLLMLTTPHAAEG